MVIAFVFEIQCLLLFMFVLFPTLNSLSPFLPTIEVYLSNEWTDTLLLCIFQCEGKQYDQKSDIWALGCILYEMACLQKTFEGSNLPALVNKIMKVWALSDCSLFTVSVWTCSSPHLCV